jgi:hypothetical protein
VTQPENPPEGTRVFHQRFEVHATYQGPTDTPGICWVQFDGQNQSTGVIAEHLAVVYAYALVGADGRIVDADEPVRPDGASAQDLAHWLVRRELVVEPGEQVQVWLDSAVVGGGLEPGKYPPADVAPDAVSDLEQSQQLDDADRW